MNKLDAEVMGDSLQARGWKPADNPKEADIVLFFGCSVRKHAEDKLFSYIGHLKRRKQKKNIIVGLLGCTAQLHKDDLLRRLPHIDLLAGPSALGGVLDAVEELLDGRKRKVLLFEGRGEDYDAARLCRGGRVSAFVRVITGCSRACSYCVVPRARGRAIPRNPESILSETERLLKNGVKEVVFIGQDVASYDFNGYDLPQLLTDALRMDGIARLGFVTSHPTSVSERLFEVMASDKRMSKYLHLPAQSGSDRILRLMRRGYTASEYLDVVRRARRMVEDVEIASDFIVGFPTETEEDFRKSVELIEECRFINSFIFKYSERPRTYAASKLKDDVPKETKRRRNIELLKVQERVSILRKQRLIGRTTRVLVEGHDTKKSDRLKGRTFNNHIVVFEGEAEVGDVVDVRIESVTALTAFGSLVP